MPFANFEELCNGFCEIAGFPAPHLEADNKGAQAMSVRLRGVYISAIQSNSSDSAILVAEFGVMPAEQAVAGWLALMDANLFMMDVDAPRFCRNPRNGEVILQWTCPLLDVSPTEIYRRVTQMVEVALLWREDPLMGGDAVSASWSTTAPAAGSRGSAILTAAARFSLFHQDICAALGQEVPLPLLETGDCTFPIRLEALNADVRIGHFPSRRAGVVFGAVPFCAPAAGQVLQRAIELMDANFTLMMDRHAATFCRDPWSGEMTLVYATALEGLDAWRFLQQLAVLAQLGRRWTDAGRDVGQRGVQLSLLAVE